MKTKNTKVTSRSLRASDYMGETDVRIENHGSVYLVVPLTEAAREWVKEFVSLDEWQDANHIAVEPRFMDSLHRGLMESGLTVER